MATRTETLTVDQLTNTWEVQTRDTHAGRPSLWAQGITFIRHFLEMAIPMLVGMVAADPSYRWAVGQFGYFDPYLQLPELSLLVGALGMTAPMAAWMAFRGMDRRCTVEMSAVMLAEALLIIGGYWLGILPNVSAGKMSSLGHLEHSLMLPAMLAAMLYRLDVYTGRAHHGTHVT